MDFKLLVILFTIASVNAQAYENKRCMCVCPSPAALLNKSITDRRIYNGNVPANKCNCAGVILPIVGEEIKGHEQEFCPRCECKFETRNTTIIMVVVIMTLWLLTMLSSYMGFLMCLDPLIKKKKKYHEEAAKAADEATTLLLETEGED